MMMGRWSTLVAFLFRACQGQNQGEAVDGEERDRYFEKKFIFIPINKTLHWSQCVVINPGAIIEHNKGVVVNFAEECFDLDAPFPAFFF
jgi:hypothetical protein